MYFEFEEQHDNPLRAKLRYAIMGGVAVLLLLALSVRSLIPSIEKDLTERVSSSLIENDLDNILITVSGRDIVLEGLISESNYSKILDLAKDIRGVRKVQDKLTLIERSDKSNTLSKQNTQKNKRS